jgi:phage regulator Rha-like protein
MKKNKITTQELAEIIVESFDEMKTYTNRIEKATSKPLEVNAESLNKLIKQHQDFVSNQLNTEKRILSSLEHISEKNATRLPNWILITLFVAYFCLFGVFLYFVFTTK